MSSGSPFLVTEKDWKPLRRKHRSKTLCFHHFRRPEGTSRLAYARDSDRAVLPVSSAACLVYTPGTSRIKMDPAVTTLERNLMKTLVGTLLMMALSACTVLVQDQTQA